MKFYLILFSLLYYSVTIAQPPEKIYLLKVAKLYDSEKNIFLKNQEILVKEN
ncbi:MAG: hypothetical protein WDO16_10515 [Bacteroidota bacterium]